MSHTKTDQQNLFFLTDIQLLQGTVMFCWFWWPLWTKYDFWNKVNFVLLPTWISQNPSLYRRSQPSHWWFAPCVLYRGLVFITGLLPAKCPLMFPNVWQNCKLTFLSPFLVWSLIIVLKQNKNQSEMAQSNSHDDVIWWILFSVCSQLSQSVRITHPAWSVHVCPENSAVPFIVLY